MTKILLIASEINRNDVGEAWVGYQWAAGLGDRHGVTLLTHGVEKHPSAAEQLPNVEVHEWLEPKVLDVIPRLNSMLKPGYLGFYAWARRWIKARLRAGETWDVVHQATPVAMRYPCPATGLELPVVIGPFHEASRAGPASVEGGPLVASHLRASGLRSRHCAVCCRVAKAACHKAF
jgi:hypothetical protein